MAKELYELSCKEAGHVTNAAFTCTLSLGLMLVCVVFITQGSAGPVPIPWLESNLRPAPAFFALHVILAVSGLYAKGVGEKLIARMNYYDKDSYQQLFRSSAHILISKGGVFAVWRWTLCFAPLVLTDFLTNRNLLACGFSLVCLLPWVALFINTINFRNPEVAPTNFRSLCWTAFKVVAYWLPFAAYAVIRDTILGPPKCG